ncbi:MAG: hypothetical protein PHX68_03550 [Alphaproteobacteria bacterium]|nr:hypothetical protein [Alphaproteobacteria bacterium]
MLEETQKEAGCEPEQKPATPEHVCVCGNGAKCCRWAGASADHKCGGNCGAHAKE